MHVAIEAVGNRSGGGWSVLTRTVAGLAADERIDRITVYCSPSSTWANQPPRADHVDYRARPAEHGSLPRRVSWYATGLAETVAADRADVVLCLNGMGRPRTPCVNLVQQAMIFADRSLKRPPSFAVRLTAIREATRRSCHIASAVVAQTVWMRGALVEHFELPDVRVIPLGLPAMDPQGPAVPERPRRILLVTGELPYKNADVVRRAFGRLREEFAGLRLDAVGVQWQGAGITSHDAVRPQALLAMYRDAALVVVPSLVESMGLPLVEAMAARCPVVAADRPYARDVCDNAALYFEAQSTDDLTRVAGEVLRDERLAADLVGRGEERFTRLRDPQPERRLADLLLEVA